MSTLSGALSVDTDINLAGGTVLTANQAQYDTFSANRTMTFSASLSPGGPPTILRAHVTAPVTLAFPSSVRLGTASNPITSLALIIGDYEFSWLNTHGIISLADSSDDVSVDTDVTLAANSDTRISSQKATKTYVDAHAGGWTNLVVSGADVTTTGQTLVDIPGLVTGTLSTNYNYEFEGVLDVSTSADTSGTAYGTHVSVAPTRSAAYYIGPTVVSSNLQTMQVSGTNADAISSSPFLTTASESGVIGIKGKFTTAATGSPVFSIQHKKVTSGTSTVKVGSRFSYQSLGSVGCNTAGFASAASVNDREGVGSDSNHVYLAGTFVADATYAVCRGDLKLLKTGSPTFNLQASIWTNVSGAPGSQIGTASAVVSSSITGSDTMISFVAMNASITSGSTYWIVLQAISSPGDTVNYVQFSQNTVSATSLHSSDGATWSSVVEHNLQFIFTLYHS